MQTLQRIEVTQAVMKNDVQQQIYKIKEFNEQLYMKQVEFGQKLDYEMIKVRKDQLDIQSQIDRTGTEISTIQKQKREINELIQTMGEAVCSLVELEAVTSALE
jgi:hypothetical protein